MKPPFEMIVETEMEKYRYATWDTKEVETISWIDSFRDGDTFFDVGANVGIYSLYCAAVHPGCKVFSFEPDLKNCLRLVENNDLNGFCISVHQRAVSDRNVIAPFFEASPVVGSSGGQVNVKVDDYQACYDIQTATIDTLAGFLGCPTHIKIDIDGQELAVVRGMRKTLRDERLKSVLIEIEETKDEVPYYFWNGDEKFTSTVLMSRKEEILFFFTSAGFTTDNPFNTMENHSRVRRAKEGINVENVVFTRR